MTDLAGPPVWLVRTGFDGTVYRVLVLAAEAVALLLAGADNGRLYASGRIEGDVSAWPLGYELGSVGRE